MDLRQKLVNEKFKLEMKTLLILFIVSILFIVGCSDNPIESVEIPSVEIPPSLIYATTFYIPLMEYIDNDVPFMFSDGIIDTTGEIKEVIFSVSHYTETVFFNFYITVDYDDILYYSPKLSTEAIETETFTINKKFDGMVRVHIYRYETVHPISFSCVIKYTKG